MIHISDQLLINPAVNNPAASSGARNFMRPKENVSFRHIGIDPRGIRQFSLLT